MNIRSCELQTHLYAIAPHHCIKDNNESGKNKNIFLFKFNYLFS